MKQIDLIYLAKPRDYKLDERSQKVLDYESTTVLTIPHITYDGEGALLKSL